MEILKNTVIHPDFQILPFRERHLENVNIAQYESRYIESLAKGYHKTTFNHDGLSYTYISDGEILCCFGVQLLWQGVGELWMMPSDNDDMFLISHMSKISELIDIIIKDFSLNRLQIQVTVPNERTLCFVKSIGFEIEGTLKNYGPEGNDYFMLARTVDRKN